MTQSLKQIADRIIICGVNDIEAHFNRNQISAVFSVCDNETPRWAFFDFSQTVNYLSAFHNCPEFLEGLEADQWKAKALEKDLAVATDLLAKSEDKRVLFHCRAGYHKSPIFVLLLLNHLQGNNPDFDLSLTILHKIRPQAKISERLLIYKTFLAKQYTPLVEAVIDFGLAKRLNELTSASDFQARLSELFIGQAVPAINDIDKLMKRFGIHKAKTTNTVPYDATNDLQGRKPS